MRVDEEERKEVREDELLFAQAATPPVDSFYISSSLYISDLDLFIHYRRLHSLYYMDIII